MDGSGVDRSGADGPEGVVGIGLGVGIGIGLGVGVGGGSGGETTVNAVTVPSVVCTVTWPPVRAFQLFGERLV